MNDLQKCELEILKNFIRVCEKHNLKYFLLYGSALGAVRHSGFIPWDDDIDVGMPREDFEKFITLQEEFKDTKYFIQTYKTDPKYIYNFAKLRDSSTTYIENYYKHFQINHGVWMDIFPIDGFSKEENPTIKKYDGWYTWRQGYFKYPWAMRRKFSRRTFFLDLITNIGAILLFWLNVGHYRDKKVDKVVTKQKYSECKTVVNRFGIYKEKDIMPKEFYGEGVKGVFEGIEVNLPSKTHEYLEHLYKNHMTPPPEHLRVGHHLEKGFSLTQGYVDYIKEHKL